MVLKGHAYRTCENWFKYIDNAIQYNNYLEIGSFYGANVLSVVEKYFFKRHYCIDPYINNEDYPEVSIDTFDQEEVYNSFLENISGHSNIILKKDFSFNVIPTFENNFFDVIYIDGNHNKPFVLEDAVLAYRKLKVNGTLVFDDYGWRGLTNKQIDYFEEMYSERMVKLGMKDTQVFYKKIK